MFYPEFSMSGFALPIDGSCGNEISIKGLDTTMLAVELKNWKRTPTVSADSLSEGTSDNSETNDEDSDSDESLSLLSPLPATGPSALSTQTLANLVSLSITAIVVMTMHL